MNPTTRYILRALLTGIVAAAASIQAASTIGAEQIVQAIVAGVIAVGLYAGVGAATPLEPKIGKKS